MLQMRENDISASKLSRGTAQLRTVEGTLTCGFPSRFLNWFRELCSFQTNFRKAYFKKMKIGFTAED